MEHCDSNPGSDNLVLWSALLLHHKINDRSDGTLPDGTLPDGTLPDGTLPDGTLPDGTLPDVIEIRLE